MDTRTFSKYAKQSGARVTYFRKGVTEEENNKSNNIDKQYKLDTNLYDGERYWVVGCIGGEGQNTYFEPHTNFFNNDPRTELTKSYCNGQKG